MDWFKHYTSSHEDPDISDAWDEFGDSAVVVFWTVLEIYGREFSHLKDGYLTISIRYFERKLRRKWKKVEKILAFFALRHRILFEKTDLTVSISIPKFIAVASNWTKRHPVSPTEVPTEASTEAPTAKEEDKEYKEIKNIYIGPLDKAIKDFKEHRQKLRKPMTDHAVDLLLKKLDTLATTDEGKIALIETAIEKGWLSVYPTTTEVKPDQYTERI